MKARLSKLFLLLTLLTSVVSAKAESGLVPASENNPTDNIAEQELKQRSLAMLARFMQYAKSIYTDAGVNARGDSCGYFKAQNAGQSDEDGVRTNADLAMVTAFVAQYGKKEGVALPRGIGYGDLQRMARRALCYAYSTHRSNKLATCKDGKHWGSEGQQLQWESPLWAMSVALAAHFLQTDGAALESVRQLIATEADAELTRKVPTQFLRDTKAEENGWDVNVLACATSMMPRHANAAKWREAMNRFAFNCYSTETDRKDTTMVEGRRASEWFAGANLFVDYTLQNHGYFHTSYQNVVMQELAESIVARQLLGGFKSAPGKESIFTWHWQEVWDEVLAPLALCDGELAMPNSNDWSLYLYDHLPAYTAMATILRNAEALMLESRAFSQLERRQKTTANGAWMLKPDIGARRMGVTAHRVMMTYLMHDLFPTADMTADTWQAFQQRHAKSKILHMQNVIRSLSEERFACFSWSNGLKNANCLIVPNRSDERAQTIVPYRIGGTGNLLGYYGNEPSEPGDEMKLDGNSLHWIANGHMFTGGGKVRQEFGIAALPCNAVVLIDELRATTPVELGQDKTGLLAISMDPLTKQQRTLYWEGGQTTTDGKELKVISTKWINIDNEIGVISLDENPLMAFGDYEVKNSIGIAKLYPAFSAGTVKAQGTCNRHHLIYYVNVTAKQTAELAQKAHLKGGKTNAMRLSDTDGFKYEVEATLTAQDKVIKTKKL